MLLPSSLRLAVSCEGSLPAIVRREAPGGERWCYRKKENRNRLHRPALTASYQSARDVAARTRLKSGGRALRRAVERFLSIGIGDGELGLRAW